MITNGNIIGKIFHYFLAILSCIGLVAWFIVGAMTWHHVYVFPMETLDDLSLQFNIDRSQIQTIVNKCDYYLDGDQNVISM